MSKLPGIYQNKISFVILDLWAMRGDGPAAMQKRLRQLPGETLFQFRCGLVQPTEGLPLPNSVQGGGVAAGLVN